MMQAADSLTITTVVSKGGGKGGAGGGQTSTHVAVEAPNTLRSRSTARILEVLSEGPVKGLATGDMRSVYLDKTPILNADMSANFSVPQYYFRDGGPDQEPIPGFPAAEAEVAVGVEMQYAVGVVRAVSPGISAIRYKVRVQALYTQTKEGDVNPSRVEYTAELRLGAGPWLPYIYEGIDGKTMSPYERAIRIPVPVTDEAISIRLTRTTPPPPDSSTSNTLFFSSFTEIVDGKLKYDDTALAAMTVDAQYFPNVPQRAYLLDGIICRVPVNYDPIARTYAGDWDGTFKLAWTDNPAWHLYEVLTNERFGVGRDIDTAAADKWSFYECAVYNDGLVPDGLGGGGMEPRFTCNCVINTRQDAFTLLNAIASNMHAALYYANGTIFIVQDREQTTPERLFSPANVENGLFDYAGTDYRSLVNAVNVTWNNPDENYDPVVELVTDPDLVAQQGYREKGETMFGCTVRGQSIRHGRWLIYTAQFETELVTFRTGLENADVRPGQLIAINDPSRAGARLGGRTLADDSADGLTLDSSVPGIAVGWTIYLTIGATVIATTVATVTDGAHMTVTGKPAEVPAGTMWLAASDVVEPTPWRVVVVKDNGSFVYEIMAAQYSPGKYPYVDLGVLIPPPPYSIFPTGPLAGPTDPHVREYIYQDASGLPQFGIILSWDYSPDSRVAYYIVEMKGPGADYRRFTNIVGVSIDVPRMRQGSWAVTICAVDNIGRKSLPLSYTFNTIGLTAKPGPPSALYVAPEGNLVHLNWVQTAEIDVAYWWVKWSPKFGSAATWERATTIAPRVSRLTVQMTTPQRAGTYFVKAVDSLGQESVGYASAELVAQENHLNTIWTINEQPTWGGALGLWIVDDTQLWLQPPLEPEPIPPGVYPGDRALALNATPTRVAVYAFLGGFSAGSPTQFHVEANLYAYGTLVDDVMAFWEPLAVAVPLARGSSSQWDGHIEARLSQDGATWGEWFPIKSSILTAKSIELRLVGSIYDLETTIKVIEAGVVIEVPNRSLVGNDVFVDASGNAVIWYNPGFYNTPTVQITARQNVVAGGSVVITLSDNAHFEVQHRNAAGVGVPGASFDYLVQGYGVN